MYDEEKKRKLFLFCLFKAPKHKKMKEKRNVDMCRLNGAE
jgi:hypothetical protein